MESPFYEMTHDYETENKIATSSYNNGYANGYLDGFNKQQERISEQLNEIAILQTQIQNFKTMLKMQEPVEPEIHMEDMSLRKDPELTIFCGACGGEMIHKYSDYPVDVIREHYKYCHHCGREILWK